MQRKNLGEFGDFENLQNHAGQTADPEHSTFVFQLFGNREDRTETCAADVYKIAQVDDEARKPLRYAGLALDSK